MDIESESQTHENNLELDITKISLLDNVDDSNLTSAQLDKQFEFEQLFRTNLSQQLLEEYRRYALEQHPKDVAKQNELIIEMQEDYYNHYIENVQTSLAIHQREQNKFLIDSNADKGTDFKPKLFPLIPARCWTRPGPDVITFKKEILSTSKQCCIKIASLSVATISVPTHIDGNSVWWEFATDHYDLGFGLFFEWCVDPTDQIYVTISDSDDEDDGEGEEGGDASDDESNEITDANPNDVRFEGGDDPESGQKHRRRRNSGPPTDEIIPIIRRDCHQSVYCGQHQYPGQGRYLFKFDNSFSLIRSKWLYYRVYFSKEE